MITLSAFGWILPFAKSYVRDLRVRRALPEAGLPPEVTLIAFETLAVAHDRDDGQPFGQVPASRDGAVAMFEEK